MVVESATIELSHQNYLDTFERDGFAAGGRQMSHLLLLSNIQKLRTGPFRATASFVEPAPFCKERL
jgi:hypothetical protein